MRSTDVSPSTRPVSSTSGTGRREIAAYPRYEQAQAAVDRLSDARFPVDRLTIVADGLRFVEQVLGRRGYKEAVLGGLASGAVLGALFGFVFGAFDWVRPLVTGLALAIYGVAFGAVAGAVIGAVGHSASAGRRDFSSIPSVEARRYAVLCDARSADEAERLLDRR